MQPPGGVPYPRGPYYAGSNGIPTQPRENGEQHSATPTALNAGERRVFAHPDSASPASAAWSAGGGHPTTPSGPAALPPPAFSPAASAAFELGPPAGAASSVLQRQHLAHLQAPLRPQSSVNGPLHTFQNGVGAAQPLATSFASSLAPASSSSHFAPSMQPPPQPPPAPAPATTPTSGAAAASSAGARTLPFGHSAPPLGPPPSFAAAAPPTAPPSYRTGPPTLPPPPTEPPSSAGNMMAMAAAAAGAAGSWSQPPPLTYQQQQQQPPLQGRYDPHAAGRGAPYGAAGGGVAYGTPSGPGGAGTNTSTAPRIDPSQVPHPLRQARVLEYRTCTPDSVQPRPPAASRFRAEDEGNASPRFMRPTMGHVPLSRDALNACGVPLGIFVQPMAEPQEGEEPVPVVDFGPAGPPRCSRCRAYVNAHARFISGGERWECNLCGASNEVALEYRCGLDVSGLRRDRATRPELRYGSVDFCVPPDYCVRPLQQPVFVFLVDASAAALAGGFTEACLGAIDAALDVLPGGDAARAGIVTFDGALHFYWDRQQRAAAAADDGASGGLGSPGDNEDAEEEGSETSLVVAVDVDDPFCPLPPEVWAPLVRSGEGGRNSGLARLRRVISRIPALIASQGAPLPAAAGRAAIGAALQAVAEGLSAMGGRVFLMAHGPTLAGVGTVPPHRLSKGSRGDAGLSAAAAAEAAAAPPWRQAGASGKDKAEAAAGGFWRKLAGFCASRQVCVDVLVPGPGVGEMGSPYADAATMGMVAAATGGQLCSISGQTSEEEARRVLGQQLLRLVTRDTALETVLKVRCGTGVAVAAYLGAGVEAVQGEMEAAGVSCDSAVACTLVHDGGKIKEGDMVAVQAALLYTSLGGRRMVRCHTVALPASGLLTTLFRSADVDSIIALLARQAAVAALCTSEPLAKCASDATEGVMKVLLHYRKNCSPDAPPGQLILPESLRLLPLFALCLSKSVPLRLPPDASTSGSNNGSGSGAEPPPDERATWLQSWGSCSVRQILQSIYPTLYSVLEAADANARANGGASEEAYSESESWLAGMSPTAERLSTDGVFLLDAGVALYLYVGSGSSPQVLLELFGVEQLPPPGALAATSGTALRLSEGGALAQVALDMAERLRRHSPVYKPLHVVVLSAGGPNETRFISLLPEDQTRQGKSYMQWLVWLHEQIKHKLQ